jgi:hypothetical protein
VRVFDNPDFASLPAEIERLFEAAGEQDFFNLPGWFDLVSRFGTRPGWQSQLIVDDSAGAAFVLQVNSRTGEIESAVTPYSCRYDAIHRDAAGSVQALARDIASTGSLGPSLVLRGFDPKAQSFDAALHGLRNGGLRAKTFFSWGNWHEAVAGKTFDAYLADRPSELVNTHRRKQKAAQGKIEFDLTRSNDGAAAEAFIADYDRVYRESWKEPEPFPHFIPELIRFAAKQEALRAGVLRIDGEAAAAQFWILWEKKALLFKLAFADKFRAHSPGTLLTMRMLQSLFEQDRPDLLDFGRGDDPYKKLWVSSRSERLGIEAANPRTVRGRIRAGAIILSDWKQRLSRSRAR